MTNYNVCMHDFHEGHGPFSHLHDKVLQKPDEREASEICNRRKVYS